MGAAEAGIGVYAYADVPGEPFPKLRGPLVLHPADRTSIEGSPARHATYRRLFSAAGRDVEVIVEFGTEHPSSGLRALVAKTLRTLSVGSD